MADNTSTARGHRHTSRCYWDLTECRWVCRPGSPETNHSQEDLDTCTSSTSYSSPTSP
jgi:hypothetical protein